MDHAFEPSPESSPAAGGGDAAAGPPASGGDRLLDLLADVEQQFERLRGLHRSHSEELAALAKRSQASEARELLDEEARQFDEERQALEDRVAQAEALASELQSQGGQDPDAAQHTARLESRISELENALTAANERAEQPEQAAKARPRRKAASGAGPAELTEQLEDAAGQLMKYARALKEQTAKLEQASQATAVIEQQKHEIERLTGQVAALRFSGDAQEMHRRAQRIAELTDALRQARGQTASDPDTAAMEQQMAELNAEVGRVRLEAEQAKVSCEEARRQLEAHAATAAAQHVEQAKLTAQEAEIAALATQVQQLQAQLQLAQSAPPPAPAQPDDSAQQALGEQIATQERELDAARTRIGQLEHELTQARTSAPAAQQPSSRSSAPKSDDDLQQKVKLMRELAEQRQQMAQQRAYLAAAEKEMVKKWARPKSVVTFGWLVGLALFVGVVSWLLAGRYFPPKLTASVVLEAKPESRLDFSLEQAANWSAWHAEMLTDRNFARTLAKRMDERRLPEWSDPKVLAERLVEDVTIDSTELGRVTLTAAGFGKVQLRQWLDIVATTMAAESNRQIGKRSDDARALVLGERHEGGRIEYSVLNPGKLRDVRLFVAAPLFCVLMFGTLTGIRRIYRALLGVKRLMQRDPGLVASGGAIVEDDATWP